MREAWTGEIVKRMHLAGISRAWLAEELGVHKSYVSMILNGDRKVSGMEERMSAALDRIERAQHLVELIDGPDDSGTG